MNRKLKCFFIFLLFASFLFLEGCSSDNKIETKKIDSMIEILVEETNIAIENKDIKKARDVWSRVTELSIKAKDNKEVSQSLEQLSTNYVKLITYLDTGEEYILKDFRKEFDHSLKELRKLLFPGT